MGVKRHLTGGTAGGEKASGGFGAAVRGGPRRSPARLSVHSGKNAYSSMIPANRPLGQRTGAASTVARHRALTPETQAT